MQIKGEKRTQGEGRDGWAVVNIRAPFIERYTPLDPVTREVRKNKT